LDKCEIPRLDDRGRKACFHALRLTFNTMLQRQGRSEIEIMQLMRVSDRKLIEPPYRDGELVMLGEKPVWWSIQRSPGRAPGRDISGHLAAQSGTIELKPLPGEAAEKQQKTGNFRPIPPARRRDRWSRSAFDPKLA